MVDCFLCLNRIIYGLAIPDDSFLLGQHGTLTFHSVIGQSGCRFVANKSRHFFKNDLKCLLNRLTAVIFLNFRKPINKIEKNTPDQNKHYYAFNK